MKVESIEEVTELSLDGATRMCLDAMESGAALKDLYAVSEDVMNDLYVYAYNFYNNGRLDDAEKFFRFLCIYDFYEAKYVVGLAAVCQLKKQYLKAVDLYALAFALADQDYRPVFFSGQCYLSMRKPVKARRCFESVVSKSKDEVLVARAKAYLSAIGQRQA